MSYAGKLRSVGLVPPLVDTAPTFTIAVGGTTNECNVTVQLLDASGDNLTDATVCDVWLSDEATGAGLTATTISTFTTETYGTRLVEYTAGKAIKVLTDAQGRFRLTIVDTEKPTVYVCVLPTTYSGVHFSRILATGDYL